MQALTRTDFQLLSVTSTNSTVDGYVECVPNSSPTIATTSKWKRPSAS